MRVPWFAEAVPAGEVAAESVEFACKLVVLVTVDTVKGPTVPLTAEAHELYLPWAA